VKIQIIYLDPQDDRFSAQDKLSWVKTSRALLVWPRRSTVLDTRLDLRVVKRAAEERGIQIGLVTFDSDVIHHAENLGIPVFQSLEDGPEDAWPDIAPPDPQDAPERSKQVDEWVQKVNEKPRVYAPQKRAPMRWVLVTVAILSLTVLALALIPSATIRILPQRSQHDEVLTLDLNLETQIGEPGGALGRIETVQLSALEVVPVHGSVEIPDTHAAGEVVFTNLTDERILIPVGTGVRPDTASPLRYATTSSGSIPAGEGNTVTLPIESVTAGPESNLPADSISALEGDLAFILDVNNPSPITGGSNSFRTGVDAADLQFAVEVAREALRSEALSALESTLSANEYLLHQHVTMMDEEEPIFDPSPGTPTDNLRIELSATFQAVILLRPALEDAVIEALETNLEEGVTLQSLLELSILEASTTEQLVLRAAYTTQPELDLVAARSSLPGLTIEDALQYLINQYPLAEEPEITLRPAWMPRLPFLEGRIDIEQMVPIE